MRGISAFTWAMTRAAFSTAAFTMSTLIPRLMKPCSSGSEVWMSATSMGTSFRLKRPGTWDRKMGV